MKTEENSNIGRDLSKCKALSIKERVEAANYAMKVKGANPQDEDVSDVSDVIGEVYGG